MPDLDPRHTGARRLVLCCVGAGWNAALVVIAIIATIVLSWLAVQYGWPLFH